MDFTLPHRLMRYVCVIVIFESYSSVCSFNVVPKTQSTISTRRAFHDHGTSRKSLSVALAFSSKSKKPNREGGAAMGFGSSATIKGNKDASVTNPVRTPQNSQGGAATKLDKWGLPQPTLEDIFPKPKDTEIIPVDPTIEYAVNHIQNYLNDSYPNNINWDYMTTSNQAHDTGPPKMLLRLAHCSPPVLMINNFLSEEECRNVQRIVTEHVEGDDDVIRVASKTISQQLALSKRTSTSWFCTYKSIPTVLAKIQHVLGISDLSRCEEPQIVKYEIGQEFTYHYDILPNEQLRNGGQRVATILIYLNTISEKNGGSTMFRDLIDGSNNDSTLFVQPVQGSALVFFPSNKNGQPDDRTLHRSMPITEDQSNQKRSSTSRLPVSKWILQIWIHETSYAACLPSKQNLIEDACTDINVASSQLGYTSKI